MKIGWVGVHAEGIPALEAVCRTEHEVVGLITLRQDKADKRCGSASYKSICQQFRVPIHEVDHINDAASIELLNSWHCDLLVVLGWGQILGSEALNTAKVGVVGAHASVLPHNRGSAPINWAIINGETHTGNSLMWLADGVDSGDLIDQRCFPITPFDTCSTLYDRVAESNREMVLELLLKLSAGERPGRTQQHTDQPVLPRRRPQDGQINWNSAGNDIYNLVRAVTRPYPGAFGDLNGQTYKIWNVAVLPTGQPTVSPGSIMGSVKCPEEKACGVVVATADCALLILEAEDEHGQVLTGRELCEHQWVRQSSKISA